MNKIVIITCCHNPLFLISETSLEEQLTSDKQSSSPRLYNIGLYKSEGTQYERLSTSSEESDREYEKISFSLTVSSEASDDELELQSHSELKTNEGLRKKSLGMRRESMAILKTLKEKMDLKLTGTPKGYDDFLDSLPETESVDSALPVPQFISTLTDKRDETIRKLLPVLRKSVQTHISQNMISNQDEIAAAEPKDSNSITDQVQNKMELKQKLNDEEKNISDVENNSKSKKASSSSNGTSEYKNGRASTNSNQHSENFTVLPVSCAHGDSLYLKNDSEYINALEIAQNGRYKDEAELFCERSVPVPPEYFSRNGTFNKHLGDHIGHDLSSSKSDVTTVTSLSAGEVTCQCSVSNGEIHSCAGQLVLDSKEKSLFSHKKKNDCAFMKTTYFNNWLTFYVQNDRRLNDKLFFSSK